MPRSKKEIDKELMYKKIMPSAARAAAADDEDDDADDAPRTPPRTGAQQERFAGAQLDQLAANVRKRVAQLDEDALPEPLAPRRRPDDSAADAPRREADSEAADSAAAKPKKRAAGRKAPAQAEGAEAAPPPDDDTMQDNGTQARQARTGAYAPPPDDGQLEPGGYPWRAPGHSARPAPAVDDDAPDDAFPPGVDDLGGAQSEDGAPAQAGRPSASGGVRPWNAQEHGAAASQPDTYEDWSTEPEGAGEPAEARPAAHSGDDIVARQLGLGPHAPAAAPSPVPPTAPAALPETPAPVIVNIMELLVDERLDEAIYKFHCCRCDKCRKDIVAITLNRLHPRYVVFDELESPLVPDRKTVTEVAGALIKAVLAVKARPRH